MAVELYLGDCLEILPALADKSVDAIITDLPYGTTACSWDEVIPFEPMWAQVKRLCRGAFVTTASQPFTSKLVMSNPDWFKYELVWDKEFGKAPGVAKYRPMPSHEAVLVFSGGGSTYNPQWRTGKPYVDRRTSKRLRSPDGHKLGYVGQFLSSSDGKRHPLSVLRFGPCVSVEGQHPTQKPIALYEYLIRTYTNAGDTVLDFCMGSGTTGAACVNTGRNFIGVEKREDYFKIAEKRIRDAQAQMVMELK